MPVPTKRTPEDELMSLVSGYFSKAYKYYPEVIEVISKFSDNIPYSKTNPHDFKLPK